MKQLNTIISKTEQPWQARWNKRFGVDAQPPVYGKAYEKGITVPASLIECDFAAIETRVAKQLLGVEELPECPTAEQKAALGAWYDSAWTDADAIAKYAKMDVVLPPLRPTTPAVKPERAPKHRTGYLDRVYDPKEFQRTVAETLEMMREHLADFDAIAFRGSSGAALAFIAAHQLDKPLIHIRKKGEDSHYGPVLEGYLGAKKIAIVDDFVASGSTIREIVDAVVDTYDSAGYVTPVFTHLFLYACNGRTSEGDVRGALGECSDEMQIHLAYDRTRF